MFGRVVVVVGLVILLVGCSSDDTSTATDEERSDSSATTTAAPGGSVVPATSEGPSATTTSAVPTSTVAPPAFASVEPEAVGLTERAIGEAVGVAEATASNCLLIARDGGIVHEQYWNGTDAATDQQVFSATKTVTAVLVGIAADEGLLSIDEPASTYLTEWVGTPSEAVTIRQLLANTSGRYQDLVSDYVDMTAAEDRSAFAIALEQQHDPDTVWVYNNAAIQTLEEVLERAVGMDVEAFARDRLFDPLGMDVRFDRDAAGNPGTYTSLQAGCRDLLAFGQLLLSDGQWGGERIVSADFLAEATRPGSALNAAYGFLLWRNATEGWSHPSPLVDTTGPAWPDAPPGAFAAMGSGQQITLVVPETGTVVVRLGPSQVEVEEWKPNFSIINALAGAVGPDS